jgi:cytochrome c oxidase cbb3-type subunit 2
MRKQMVVAIAVTLLQLSAGARTLAAQETRVGKLTGNPSHGKALYQRYCVFCHGEYGDGRGESAPYLSPKPRDFTRAKYKCRSIPGDSLPADVDLYDTISRGIHASGMPSWKPLLRQDRIDLVAYIKTFSPRFKEEKPAVPLVIPPEPPTSGASVQRGAELFQSMNCWLCHGKEGRGNGPSAVTLTDSQGYPIAPFDFTSGMQFKCGDSDQTIFRDLTIGLDGTPMPSFADALKPDQMWDVVHYIHSLSEKRGVQRSQVEIAPQKQP